MRKYLLFLLFFIVHFVQGQNIKITEATGPYKSCAINWQTVSSTMGYNATIVPVNILDNTSFFNSTDILILSDHLTDYTPIQKNNIQAFIKSGKSVYLQTESMSTYSSNQLFSELVTSMGGAFKWVKWPQGEIHGDLASSLQIKGTFSSSDNAVTSLNYFWWAAEGIAGQNVFPFLIVNSREVGWCFCPSNPSYGKLITVTDQNCFAATWDLNLPLLMKNILKHLATPSLCGPPTPSNCNINVTTTGNSICKNTTASLTASGADAYNWYDTATGGNLLSSSNPFTTPVLNNDTTYYVEGIKRIPATPLETVFNQSTYTNGYMFDVKAAKDITITDFEVSPTTTGSYPVEVYYREGGYEGHEKKASDWILLGTARPYLISGSPSHIQIGGLNITNGKTYGIYITAKNFVFNVTFGDNTYSDGTITINTGVGNNYPFQEFSTKRTFNGRVHYTTNCIEARKAVAVELTPTVTLRTSSTKATCIDAADGTAEVNVSNVAAPYTFSWNTTPVQTTFKAIGLKAGTYTVTVTDNNGCKTSEEAIVAVADAKGPTPDVASLEKIISACDVVKNINTPTATDNCLGKVYGTTTTVFPIQASTRITWTYTDGTNTSSQYQDVVIPPCTAPVPDIPSLPLVNDQCSVATITPPTATDSSGRTVKGTSTTTFPITASTKITWYFTDGLNTSSQEQNVVINDVTAPVPDKTALPDVREECSVAAIPAPTATDACIGLVMGKTNTKFPITKSTVVEWTYTDGVNIKTQLQNVVINDLTAPVPDKTALPDVREECSVVAIPAPTATDKCIGLVMGKTNTKFPITKSTVVEWTYTDGVNIKTQLQNVVINDLTAPVPDKTALPDVREECSVAAIPAPTATDACIGLVMGKTNTKFPITKSTVVEWTYTDGVNTKTQNQNVVINDVTAPVPDKTALPEIKTECSVAAIPAPTAADACIGKVMGKTNTKFPITKSTVVEWTYTDGVNIKTQLQNVVINDITAPKPNNISLLPVNSPCSVQSIASPTATDNCSGQIIGKTTAAFPITASTKIRWTYTDGVNTSYQDQDVVITDITAPKPDKTSLAPVIQQCIVAAITSPTATDNCKGQIIGKTTTSFPITTSTKITWTYTDGVNISYQEQDVVINSCTATGPVPDLASLPPINEQCQLQVLMIPYATDSHGKKVRGRTTTTLPITTSTKITWTYTDGTNTSYQDQDVTITDITAPVPDKTVLTEVKSECSVAAIPAPTATDACIGLVMGKTNTKFPITKSTVVEWTYTDGVNIKTQLQNVVINDLTAPVPDKTALPDVREECSVAAIPAPTATDACIGLVMGKTNTKFPITKSTVVEWTYTDGVNTKTQNQNVVINDVTAPVPDKTALPEIKTECSVAAILSPTATDACIGKVYGTTNTKFPITKSTVVEWTYTDGVNTKIQYQNVVIADITAPVPDKTVLDQVKADCSVAAIPAPTAADACIGKVYGTTNTKFPITKSTVVEWTYTDGVNTRTQYQNVVIADITAPVPDKTALDQVKADCSVTAIPAPTSADACIGKVFGKTNTKFPITASTTVRWTYSDGVNTSYQDQQVVITDGIAPIPDLPFLPAKREQCSVAAITPPTATDNCRGLVRGTTAAVFPITASTRITWTYTDGKNSSTQYQDVIITDNTPPVITCIGDQALYCAVTIPDYTALVSASDNCDPFVLIRQVPAPGSPFIDGMTIKMEAADSKGNSSQCSFKVIKNTLSVNAGSDLYIKEGETVQLQAAASTAGNFKWNPASGLSNLYVPNPTASPLQTTTYTVTFKTPDGCQAQDNVTVFVQQNPKDDTKYGISPNDDGINDFWKIDTIEENPDNEVYIYNRWGDLVFYIKNYNNTSNVFNGTANRKKNMGADVLPEGTYFFDIKIKGSHHLKKTSGFLVLKR